MKKNIHLILVILTFSFLMSSCMTTFEIPAINQTDEIDLREYSDKDFLITSDGFSDKYKSCGFVTSELYPEVTFKVRSREIDESEYTKYSYYAVQKIHLKDAIEAIYKKAKSLGANAIINFEIQRLQHPFVNTNNQAYEDIKSKSFGYSIKGLAIKRVE